MALTLQYHPEALAEVRSARQVYEEQRPGLGDAMKDELDAVLDQILVAPELPAKWPDWFDRLH